MRRIRNFNRAHIIDVSDEAQCGTRSWYAASICVDVLMGRAGRPPWVSTYRYNAEHRIRGACRAGQLIKRP